MSGAVLAVVRRTRPPLIASAPGPDDLVGPPEQLVGTEGDPVKP